MKSVIEVKYLPRPSTDAELDHVMCINLKPNWMDPIMSYLRQGTLPSDSKEAHIIKLQLARYWVFQKGRFIGGRS